MKVIRRFLRKLFCNHTVKDKIGMSHRRNKNVYQCYQCGKLFYKKY